VTTIVVVRHAESVRPAAGGLPELERPLTPAGLVAAAELVGELSVPRPTAVVSSPYLRAVQTVTPLAESLGLPVETRWELREWDRGFADGPDWASRFEESWADLDLVRSGGESLRQLTLRALAAIRKVADDHPGGLVVVGSHGTFISRLLAGLGHRVDWPFSRDMPMPAVYRLTGL
jgi:2,3-bisphosphoglycerate-dependent phosphoglycerate mutase